MASNWVKVCVICLLVSLHFSSSFQVNKKDKHTVVVLVGATGDLASKYLWQALFNVYSKALDDVNDQDKNGAGRFANQSFSFIGAARQPEEKGMVSINNILSKITCPHRSIEDKKVKEGCAKRREDFTNNVIYLQLKEDQHFEKFCQYLSVKFKSSKNTFRELVLYLSISPSAYESVIHKVKKSCNEKFKELRVDVKWALEKPFGKDKQSAETLSDKVLQYAEEREIYRVDHYLGKSLVQTILPFRSANPELDHLMNKENVERVEVFLKETVGVQDRVSFYNEMGVLRDIHQSHLTELLILISMYLPSNIHDSSEISENKANLLRQVKSVRSQGALFGQYADYVKHVTHQYPNNTEASSVPTFAAALLKINSPRWQGVPFLLVSGKHLDKRESYIRIIFKNKQVCISNCNDAFSFEKKEHQQQIIFHIGHGDLSRPAILVSKSLGKPHWPDNIKESSDSSLYKSSHLYGEKNTQFYAGAIIDDIPAYQTVFSKLIEGNIGSFVNTRNLLLSWHIWDHIVTKEKKPRIYTTGDPSNSLNVIFSENRLTFAEHLYSGEDDLAQGHSMFSDKLSSSHTVAHTPASYLGRKLVTGKKDLLSFSLVNSISQSAEAEIKKKGAFHIAFPGGTSIIPIFQLLAHSFHNIQWPSIHVWQVDERCVPRHHNLSNFESLDRELLRFVDIPFANIHSMPVDIDGDICDDQFGGEHMYAESIKHAVPNSKFDFLILGLGSDGHVASLFPESTALHVNSGTLVTITNNGPKETPKRMTLTLPLINQAKHIAVIAFGEHKRNIVKEVEKSKSVEEFPILGVSPRNGTLTWYIDDVAFEIEMP